jgi:hypothetical protein
MAEAKSKKTAPKLFDVAKPGKSAPSSTSRPVIITNRPVLKDPMVIKVDTGDDEAQKVEPTVSGAEVKHKIDIKPLHIDLSEVLTPGAPEVAKDDKPAEETSAEEKPGKEDAPEMDEAPAADDRRSDEPAEVSAAAETAAKADEAPTEEKPETPAPESPKTSGEKVIAPPVHDTPEPEETEDKPSDPAPEVTPPAEESPLGGDENEPSLDNSDKPVLSEKEAKAAEEAKQKAEEQEKIIASGQYYLPINAVEKRRTRRNVILGTLFIVVLVAVAALAAWDAGIFNIPGYQAPTNFL